jgi:hypothetical protein
VSLSALLENLPKWIVRPTSDPKIFHVTTNSWVPFRARLADERRIEFVTALRRELPFLLLWLEKGRANDVLKNAGSPAVSNADVEFWLVPETLPINQLLPKLREGEWGIFFFAKRPEHLPFPPVPLMPSRQPRASDLLGLTGAHAAIVSEPDDTDWLVASY